MVCCTALRSPSKLQSYRVLMSRQLGLLSSVKRQMSSSRVWLTGAVAGIGTRRKWRRPRCLPPETKTLTIFSRRDRDKTFVRLETETTTLGSGMVCLHAAMQVQLTISVDSEWLHKALQNYLLCQSAATC